jgi:integrase
VKKKLTDLIAQNMKLPASGQLDIFDKGFPGLALRLSYGGSRTWIYSFRGYSPKAGRVTARRATLGSYPAMNVKAARDAWRDAHASVQSGRDPTQKASDDTIAGAVEAWLATIPKQRTRVELERAFRRDVLPLWATRKIADIEARDCLNLIDGIVRRGAPVMANRSQDYLSWFFGWAVGRLMIDRNPLAGLKRPVKEQSRDRVLDDKELASVWRASETLGWQFRGALRLAILTGLRREEVSALRWSEIVDGEIRLAAERCKNARAHILPLSKAAQAVIADLPRIVGSDFVFPGHGRKPITNWADAMSQMRGALTIPHFTLHDLRRSCATGLQRLGTPLQVTEAVLNHAGSRAGIAGIYQRHDYAEEKRLALEAWGRRVMGVVDGRKDHRHLKAATS